jgi:hypothetical protein
METRPEVALAAAYSLVWPYLDERQRRLLLAPPGRGGLAAGGSPRSHGRPGPRGRPCTLAWPSWTIQLPAVGCPPGAFGALAVGASG